MQSTGQAGTQSSQPVHKSSTTVCMNFAPPAMASTGQAWMHLVQPMQSASMINANFPGECTPRLRSYGGASTPNTLAKARAPASPPGGQRSGSASPRVIASAYGRHPSKPHCPHWVCGRMRSRRSVVGSVDACASMRASDAPIGGIGLVRWFQPLVAIRCFRTGCDHATP